MKRYRNSLILTLAVVVFALASVAAEADTLTLTLDSAFQSGSGTVYDFTGTIDYTSTDSTNDGGVTEYLNSDSSFVSSGTIDDSPYLNNAPLSMNPSDASGDIDLFTVTVPNYIDGPVSENTYTGFFSIVGGPTDASSDVLATEDFEIVVTPEPPTWELMALALMALLGFVRWNSRQFQTTAA